MIPLIYSVRSLRRRPGTSAATAIGMAAVVFILAASMMLVDGVNRTLATSGRADNAILLRQGAKSEQDSTFELTKLNAVLAQPGVKREGGVPMAIGENVVVPMLPRSGANPPGTPGAAIVFRLTTEAALRFRPEVRVVEGTLPRAGTNEIMFGKALKNRIKNLEVGQTLQLRRKELKVVGVFEAGGSSTESEVWGDLAVLSPIFLRQELLSTIHVRLESPGAFEAFRASVSGNKSLGLQVERETTYFEKQAEGLSTMYSVMGGAISVLGALGAMIGAMITMYSAVATRKREVGTLRALGFTRTNVVISFVVEAMLLTGIGGAIGAGASMLMGYVRFSTLNVSNFTEIVLRFYPTPKTILIAVGTAVVLGLFGGLLPAIRAARISPVAAMRG